MNNKIRTSYSLIILDDITKGKLLHQIIDYRKPKKKTNMKPIFILVSICCLLFVSYSLFPKNLKTTEATPKYSINSNTSLNSLPKDISVKYARDNNFYVNVHGTIYNKNILDDFLKNVNNSLESSLIIAQYTVEGDPILTEIKYLQDYFLIHIDTTRDKFGKQDIVSHSYANIGYYRDNLYAYSDHVELNEETISNNQCLRIL